jgi:hypothetical protein
MSLTRRPFTAMVNGRLFLILSGTVRAEGPLSPCDGKARMFLYN